MEFKLTYKPFGNKAILIEWKPIINEEILNDIILFKEKIKIEKTQLFSDIIIGYNSLTLTYVAVITNFSHKVEELKSIYNKESFVISQENFIWEIPVCYDLAFGIDLKEISKVLNLSTDKIIKLHSERIYTVFFIGFLPGFLYLGGLHSNLYFDRKPNPRLKVVKGAVAIGGKQTGIYPSNSAGGWNIIGKTPIHFFDVKKANPCFAKAGDKITFKPISLDEFYQLEKQLEKDNYIIPKTLFND
ncbi:5-oxoprolinase subunit PxpB [uncultured Polaribacter sp.]|uniref:5-oxoprolinase subunit PxpB n=1 Tax=uncultured Polaribacter sp. TaxID=174711 RepID=UPI00261B45A7|nr:5-oxoprolinase subunit PxpB [uncultured Polaribacter sp.]